MKSGDGQAGDGVAATTIRIDGEMTIYRAADLKSAFFPLESDTPRIHVDLSAVTEIDSAGVQLLLLAQRDAQALGRELRLTATSPAVDEVFALLDLHGRFGLATAA